MCFPCTGRFPEPERGSGVHSALQFYQWTRTAKYLGNIAPHLFAPRNQLGDVQHLEAVVFN